jgi:hypothetical protein
MMIEPMAFTPILPNGHAAFFPARQTGETFPLAG